MSANNPTPNELRQALQQEVDKAKSSDAQAHLVMRALSALAYRKAPKVTRGTIDGSTILLYVWPDSPMGELILATGPAFLPRILDASEIASPKPGVYVLSEPDERREREGSAYIGRHKGVVARERVVKPPPPPRAPPPARVAPPSANDVALAEREELARGLAALFG